MPPPWVFAVTGTLIVMTSAAVSGFYTSYLERLEARLQSQKRDTDETLEFKREQIAAASEALNFANVRLAVFESTNPPADVFARGVGQVVDDVLRGLIARYSAATDHAADAELPQEWFEKGRRARERDWGALAELTNISEQFMLQWGSINNELVKARSRIVDAIQTTRRKIVHVRFTTVSLQLLGTAVVLMKDVV